MKTADIEHLLCTSFCADVRTRERPDGSIQIATPFIGRDGDTYNFYVKRRDGDVYRVTDKGSTLMRLSYENDLKFLKGARKEVLDRIIAEYGAVFDRGEIFIDTFYGNIAKAIFDLGQALTRVSDIGIWTKNRVKSTFYDDLDANLLKIVTNSELLRRDYYSKIDKEFLYPIDYYISSVEKKDNAVAVFGVPDTGKARLATIVMSKLSEWEPGCSSIVVLNGLDNVSRPDLKRLMDVANDFVSEVNDTTTLRKKVEARVA